RRSCNELRRFDRQVDGLLGLACSGTPTSLACATTPTGKVRMRPFAPGLSFLALVVVSMSGKAQFANVDACTLLTGYYMLPKAASPILIAKKGNAYFQIKVLNGLKVKPPLSADEVKARELVLGKAAAGRV